MAHAPAIRSPVAALPRVHQLVLPTPWPVGPVQLYLIESEPLTLVDTGVRSPDSRAALESGLDALGYGLEDVERVVLTHHHEDHLGQAQTLRDAGADCEVWAHAVEAPACEGFGEDREADLVRSEALFRELGVPEAVLAGQREARRASRAEAPLCEPTRVDRTLEEGEAVPLKDLAFRVIHAPGHTAGHILLHEERSGVLLTGDHVMGDAVPFTDYYLTEGPPDPADPLARTPRFRGLPRYMRSLRELRGRHFRTFLPAHGGVIDRPARALEEAKLFYEVRIQRVARALRRASEAERRPVSAWEVWRTLYPKADPVTQMRTRLCMVAGALDLLEEEGSAETSRRDDGALVHGPR